MGVAQELGDIGTALAFARPARALSGSDADPIVLGGFSHGAELAYAYAAAPFGSGGDPAAAARDEVWAELG